MKTIFPFSHFLLLLVALSLLSEVMMALPNSPPTSKSPMSKSLLKHIHIPYSKLPSPPPSPPSSTPRSSLILPLSPPSPLPPSPLTLTLLSILPPLIASLSSLIQGCDNLIAGALLFFPLDLQITSRPDIIGFILTSSTLGAILGSIVVPRVLDKRGRAGTLKLSGLFSIIAATLNAYAPNYKCLIAGRFISGIGIGACSVVVPLYIVEISPSDKRGAYSTFPQFAISTGILLSYVSALIVIKLFGPNWRVILGMAFIPACLQMIMSFFFLPESPRWLIKQGGDACLNAARFNLGVMRRGCTEEEVDVEFEDLVLACRNDDDNSAHEERKEKEKATISGMLRHPKARKAALTVITLQMFQQLCGINAIVFYTPIILKEAGVPALLKEFGVTSDPNIASLLSTILAYAPKIPAITIAGMLMDVTGRRSLLLRFVPVMGIALFSLGFAFRFLDAGDPLRGIIAIASIGVYGVVFVMSLGPIPNILSSEIFPDEYRSLGLSVSCSVQWMFNAIVAMLFPVVQHFMGTQFVLGFFGGMCVLCEVFTYCCVEETKGRSLEELGGD